GEANLVAAVRAKVVEDDNIAGLKGGTEQLLDVAQEPGAVDRAVEHHGSGHSVQAQRREEGGCLPSCQWDLTDQALAAPATPAQTGHVVLGPGLVDEDQAGRVEVALQPMPSHACVSGVGSVLLSGAQTFF